MLRIIKTCIKMLNVFAIVKASFDSHLMKMLKKISDTSPLRDPPLSDSAGE